MSAQQFIWCVQRTEDRIQVDMSHSTKTLRLFINKVYARIRRHRFSYNQKYATNTFELFVYQTSGEWTITE